MTNLFQLVAASRQSAARFTSEFSGALTRRRYRALQGGKLSGLTTAAALAARAKGDAQKVALAALLRRQTPMTRAWIARRLARAAPCLSPDQSETSAMTEEPVSIVRTGPFTLEV